MPNRSAMGSISSLRGSGEEEVHRSMGLRVFITPGPWVNLSFIYLWVSPWDRSYTV